MQTFFSISGFIFIFGNLFVCLVPSSIDGDSLESRKASANTHDEQQVVDVPYSNFFKNKRTVMTLLAYSTTALIITFYDPILSIRLNEIGVK